MRIGDLIEYEGSRWVIVSYDKLVRVGLALDAAGARREVADDAEGLVVVGNPASDWPTIMAPLKLGAGPFVKLSQPGLPGQPERVLEPWTQWIQSDPVRDGGSLFIHPSVRLLNGEVLLAQHRNGTVVRLLVPRNFGTVAQRQARVVKPVPPEPMNRFNHILDDDE